MNAFLTIILAVVLALHVMITTKQSTEQQIIPLTRGLMLALLVALAEGVAVALGHWLGTLLQWSISNVDELMFVGLLALVALRYMLTAFNKHRPPYNLADNATLLLFPIATSINHLLAGMAVGFITSDGHFTWLLPIAVACAGFLLVYWGVMSGRRQLVLHPRRWYLLGALFLLMTAVSVYLPF
ncbi:MAG: manganese efflux pump [Bacteroidales bacterium]|nr:manganese efflux pump [Bacteroidales bacterium]MBQ9639935.1 manganese efflux pump [Bacteroidales bacterium]